VLNKRGKFCVTVFLHYTDIAIFVMGHFTLTHPVVDNGGVIKTAGMIDEQYEGVLLGYQEASVLVDPFRLWQQYA